MSFQEVLKVKDDILKNNRELEEKIKSHIDVYGNKFKVEIDSFSERIDKVTDSNDKFLKTLPDINYKLSKIEQIEKFNVRTDHKMTSFEVRISTILDQIEKIKSKYDKIILDNLFVSGHIGGAHSQYENLSEYLLANINDVNLLKLEKDQMKKDFKVMKGKQDSLVKQTVNLIDSSVQRCNLYADNKQKDFEQLLESKTREFNEKIMEIRMNVCKIQMQTEEAVNNLTIGFDKMKQENNFFLKSLNDRFNEMKNEVTEFINEYKSRLVILNKDNNLLKKETKNIKENIENIVEILEYQNSQNTKNIKEIQQYFLESMESPQKKRGNLKGSYHPSMIIGESPIKKKIKIYSPSPKKGKRKLLNSINVYQTKMSPIKRNTKKRRNTIAYTEPIFTSNMIKKFKDRSNVKSPKFLGITPLLKNIINFKDDEKSERFDKSLVKKNESKLFDLNSTIKSIQLEKEKKINNSNSKNSESSNSSKNNNSVSKTESESNSLSVSVTYSNEEKKEEEEKFQRLNMKRRPSSRKNFTKLSLKKKTKIENNAENILNILHDNQNINKKYKRRGSVGLLGSANIMYKNDDISEILVKKFSKKADFNNNKIIIEDSKNNYIKNKNNEKIPQNEQENIMKDNENNLKNNNSKSRLVNLIGIAKNNKIINNNNLNSINLTRGNVSNERYNSNTLEAYSPFSKNQKRNYIITTSKEDQGIGYKIVSFDIPENINLPQRTTQVYSLNGKKLKKKPNKKTDFVSPLDELYKQQFKKKKNDLKISANSNMMIVNNANDVPKKLLPIFGRTAYTFYGNNEQDAGINLANSLDLNKDKNKNTIHNFHATKRIFNSNSLKMNNINPPFNTKAFPKLNQKFNTEKNV